MGRPKKVKAEAKEAEVLSTGETVVKAKAGVATEYTPIQKLTDVEEAALTPEAPSSPENTLEGKDAPKVSGSAPIRQVSTKERTVQRFASEVQQRVFDRAKAREAAKDKRRADILKQAEEAAKGYKLIVIPYKDRNEEIVPAIVLGVIDQPKKDKGGHVLDENNEQVMESVLRLFVLSNIDEPRKVLYNFGGK